PAAVDIEPEPIPEVLPLPAEDPALPAETKVAATPKDACDREMVRAGLALPADFRLLAAGAYQGRDLGFQIDQSGHSATQIDVVVTSRDKPVALMLGAYEPTI